MQLFPEFVQDLPVSGRVLLDCSHDPRLVLLSCLVAWGASYIALRLASEAPAGRGLGRTMLMGLCAISLGGGIWAMHFVAMLAWQVPIAVEYSGGLTFASLLVAVIGTLLAFSIVISHAFRWLSLLLSGLLMGASIVFMHYSGMGSIVGELRIVYDRQLFVASCVVAVTAATAALFIVRLLQHSAPRHQQALTVGASLIMALAITGMHYTGMAAALPYVEVALSELPAATGTNYNLAINVLLGVIVFFGIGLMAISFQRVLHQQADLVDQTMQRYQQMLSIPDAVLLVNAAGRVQACNQSAMKLFRFDSRQPDIELDLVLPTHDELGGKHDARFIETSASRINGDEFPVEYSFAESVGEDEEFSVLVCRDISERKAMLQQIQELLARNTELAMTDPLTGLSNRRALDDLLQRELSRCVRFQHPLCLLLIDIDHFKRINDDYGHLTGDEALREIGGLLREVVRSTDLPGRFGGEELLVLLPETNLAEARVLCERIRASVEELAFESPDNGRMVTMTCSIGLCEWREGDSFESLFARVDKAMYKAKHGGRNQVQVAG